MLLSSWKRGGSGGKAPQLFFHAVPLQRKVFFPSSLSVSSLHEHLDFLPLLLDQSGLGGRQPLSLSRLPQSLFPISLHRRPPSQPREAKKCHNLSNTGKGRTCPPNPAVLCTHTRVICPFDDQRRREEKPMAPTGKRATRSGQRRVQAACSIARRQNT